MDMLKSATLALLVTGPLILTGCDHNDDDSDDDETGRVSYELRVTNLTAAQPLSPLAVVLHDSAYSMWSVGSSAGDGLEYLAEGGDNTELLSEAANSSTATMSGGGIIAPGQNESLIIEADEMNGLALSFATMLVNTNDAFTGINAVDVSDMMAGSSKQLFIAAYDAGTEGNSELASTVPGPAAGGEGYNPARDDRDSVGGHPGVVTHDDGLSGSALNESHRFDNPVAHVTITRMQ
ncbi:MAG: spondin domain-containing protein [Candidatus Thiodiazotropha sp. (ex. Lucinisca nassula)]|nr:spondin domain-containing protein [Candidatus Thiodiazotropha sp. (ex. Lucinisca nassula)]